MLEIELSNVKNEEKIKMQRLRRYLIGNITTVIYAQQWHMRVET